MIPAEMLLQLSSLGLSSEQYTGVLSILASQGLLLQSSRDADDKRREEQRLRAKKYRENKKGVTLCERDTSVTQQPIKERSLTLPKENIYIQTRASAHEAWPSDYREQFWAAYPRKIGKGGAMRRLEQIRGKVPFQRIMDAVRKYCSANHDPKFIKHPETWLNKGCWDDEVSTSITPSLAPRKGFYASFASREREAWDAYGRTVGKTYPKGRDGGWEFPTRWPPGHEEVA